MLELFKMRQKREKWIRSVFPLEIADDIVSGREPEPILFIGPGLCDPNYDSSKVLAELQEDRDEILSGNYTALSDAELIASALKSAREREKNIVYVNGCAVRLEQ